MHAACSVTQSSPPTSCGPHGTLFGTLWAVVHQTPICMGFSRQEYCSGLPFPPSEDLPDPGIQPTSPTVAGRFFTTEPPERPGSWS